MRDFDVLWPLLAACRGPENTHHFFPVGHWNKEMKNNVMRQFCGHCPVRAPCLAAALTQREEMGIWAGFSYRELRHFRAKYGETIEAAKAILRDEAQGKLGRRRRTKAHSVQAPAQSSRRQADGRFAPVGDCQDDVVSEGELLPDYGDDDEQEATESLLSA